MSEKRILMTIEEFEFSIRTYNCLKRAGILNSDDLIEKTYSDMVKVRNLGRKGLEEIIEKLHSLGMDLKDDGVKRCPICKNEVDVNGVICVECAFKTLMNSQLSALDKCAKEDVAVQKYQFDYSKDEKGIVIEGYLGEKDIVVIPKEIEGLPVYKIESEAFFEDEKVIKVTLPETVSVIGDSAFCESSLECINIPSSATVIGSDAFNGTKIKKATIPQSLTYLGSGAFSGTEIETLLIPNNIKVVPYALCDSCEKLHTVIIQGATEIKPSAFENCYALENVFLPDGLTLIGDDAFNNTALEKIIFPVSVKSIGSGNYPDYSHVAILGNSTQIDLSSYGENITIYCNQDNSKVRREAREEGVPRKQLSDFPRE